jgi:hypothetical protein
MDAKILEEFNYAVDDIQCVCKCGLYLVCRKNNNEAKCHNPDCGEGVSRTRAIQQNNQNEINPTMWYCYNCSECNKIGEGDLCSGCSYPQSYSENYNSDLDEETANEQAHDTDYSSS